LPHGKCCVLVEKIPLTISFQKAILSKYAKENGFNNLSFFVDDGYSGTNFNRPSWGELIEKIENGEVSTLIVKDMSRLGRDYLKVGFYTEVLFVEKGVRFIAINNGIDSANQTDSDFTRFSISSTSGTRKIRARKSAL
jgi:DNA invertase Pin-like site-specific DNA recombinase